MLTEAGAWLISAPSEWLISACMMLVIGSGLTTHYIGKHWPQYVSQLFLITLIATLLLSQAKPPLRVKPSTSETVESLAEETAPNTSYIPSTDADILSLFSPENPAEASLGRIKHAFEKALNASYILARCQPSLPAYTAPTEAFLKQRLMELAAEYQSSRGIIIDTAQLYASILSAAEGSYQLFYQYTPCDTPELAMTEQQLKSFILGKSH